MTLHRMPPCVRCSGSGSTLRGLPMLAYAERIGQAQKGELDG
jgi:hypothetical protein